MADRTGRALGTLNPVIYFEMARLDGPMPRGHCLLAPQQIGEGTNLARKIFETRYKQQGYVWHEAGTLADVDVLQNRLVDQELRLMRKQAQTDDRVREQLHRQTASNLRQRMSSSSCSPWEREFIRLWLEMSEQKRQVYTQRWMERNMYLWARENDDRTRVEDRMGRD